MHPCALLTLTDSRLGKRLLTPPEWLGSHITASKRRSPGRALFAAIWGLLGIRVNFYHFLLVEGMMSEKGFAAILF